MRIEIQIDGDGLSRLRDMAEYEVPDARRRMVERGMETALENTLELNPIRTGRSRAAWKAALDELHGEADASSGSGGPISEGASLGSLTQSHDHTTSTISATNAVSYVPFLEYGTSRMSPFQMVRKSLATVRDVIARWFVLE